MHTKLSASTTALKRNLLNARLGHIKWQLLLILTLLLTGTSAWSQQILYVNDGSTTGDVFTNTAGSDAFGTGSPTSPYATIGFAMANITTSGTIYVDAGTYVIGSTINVNKPVIINGAGSALTKLQTSGAGNLFLVTASGAGIKDVEIEKTESATQNIIAVQANNFELASNNIHGQYAFGASQVDRGLEISPSVTGVNIHDNTFRKLRQPGYINGNASTGTVNNNLVQITRGWVVEGNSLITFSNNAWGSGADVNYYDIAIIQNTPSNVTNNYPDIVTMSNTNNDAVIENQKFSPALLSIVHVDKASLAIGLNGSVLDPYKTIAPAISRVAPGGKILIASGNYNEQVIINRSAKLIGTGATQPVIDLTGTPTNKLTLFDISADAVTINNLHFNVNLATLSSAVIASAPGIDNITITGNVIDAYGIPPGSSPTLKYGDRNAVSINYTGFNNYRVASGGVNNIQFNNNTVNIGSAGAFRAAICADEASGTFTGNILQSINQDILLRFNNPNVTAISNNTFNGGGLEISDLNTVPSSVAITDNIFHAAFANVFAPNTAVLRLKNNQYNWAVTVSGNKLYDAEWGLSMENFKNVSVTGNEFTPPADSTTYHHLTVNTKSISSNSSTIVQTQISASITNNTFNSSAVIGGTAIGFYNHDNDAASFGAFGLHSNSFAPGIGSDIYIDGQTGASNNSTFPFYNVNIGIGAGAVTTMAAWTAPVDASCNWWGTSNNNTFASKIGSNVTYTPWLTGGSDVSAATGFQPGGSCDGDGVPVSNLHTTGVTNVNCYGGSDGTATIAFANGFPPYSYSLNGGAYISVAGSPFTITGLIQNPTYNITVKDGGDNTAASSFAITQPTQVTVTITPSLLNFCSNMFLTASATGATGPYSYLWSSTETTSIKELGGNDADGNYMVTATTTNGCSGTATYSYLKQNLVNNYTILALADANLGESNIVYGAVGDTGKGKKIIVNKNSVINGFIKSPLITLNPPVTINSTIGGTGLVYDTVQVVLPLLLSNTAASSSTFGTITVPDDGIATISADFKNITIGKRATVTINSSVIGHLVIHEATDVIFTAPDISIDDIKTDNGKDVSPTVRDYTTMSFAANSSIRVKSTMALGSKNRVNSSGATFYMSDLNPDAEKVTIAGLDHKFSSNIYMPHGKINITVAGSADRDNCVMTGKFIAEHIVSNKYVVWSGSNCDPLRMAQGSDNEKLVISNFDAMAYPNPTTSAFRMVVQSNTTEDMIVNITDISGRLIQTIKHPILGYTEISFGENFNNGMYFAEVVQGNNRKVIKLIKML